MRRRSLRRPDEITRPILERYQRHLFRVRRPNGRPLSVRTQRNRLGPVKDYFRWLAKRRHLVHNPASELELPRLQQRLPTKAMSIEEVEAVLRGPDLATPFGVRDRAILETFYSTAMRRAELLSLDLYDIQPERGWAVIREGKGRKDRVVPIGERCLEWIDKYLEESRPLLVTDPAEPALFPTKEGNRFTPHRLSQMVHRAIDAADLGKSGSCHLFRHTAATLMLEGGADIRYIQQLLGHQNLQTTQIYTRVSIVQLQAIHRATHPGARLERRRDPDELLDD